LEVVFNMEADVGGGFQYGGGSQRQISIWSRMSEAIVLVMLILEGCWGRGFFNMEADAGGGFHMEADFGGRFQYRSGCRGQIQIKQAHEC
jgi:hypothetical protein